VSGQEPQRIEVAVGIRRYAHAEVDVRRGPDRADRVALDDLRAAGDTDSAEL
jgi:hypothetical protein